MGTNGSNRFSGAMNDAWRKLVFFVGDVRKLGCFPWVTWSLHTHRVHLEEVLDALPLIKYGDIGLHRDWGYLSNVAIPGFMKHAWIHTQDGVEQPQIVEAISEGIVKRCAIYPMYSDYTIILTPRGPEITDEERKGACKKANQIVGAEYDVHFRFDIDEELNYYRDKEKDAAAEHLKVGNELIRKYDHGFSCTEVASYCWWHRREVLQLYRTVSRGKPVILADSFLNRGWRVKWMSESVTVDIAHKMGLGEEGVSLIEDYKK